MTKNEKEAIKAWNIAQGTEEDEATKRYLALRKKYVKLNGSASCSQIDFMREVATCSQTSDKEKFDDIDTIIAYHEARGRYNALLDYISTVEVKRG